MFNSIGTIFRALLIFMVLFVMWFFVITAIYYIAVLIVGIEFSIKIAFIIFIFFMTVRSFYPRNIFK